MRLLLLLLKKGTLHEAIGFLMSPPFPKKVNPAGGDEDPLAPPQKGSPASSSKIPYVPYLPGDITEY